MKKLVKWLVRSLGYEIREIPPTPPQTFADETTDGEYELLRAFATRAAQLSAPADETQAIRHLHLTGILRPQPSSQGSRIEVGGVGTSTVGIWSRESNAKEAAFIRRSDRRDEWFSWASKQRIEPKRHRWRVVLLGESVARGYLYDPQLTPAAVLEAMLGSELGAAEIDVVDLAKSNLTIEQLKVAMGECLALQPDVIVVFAGNNWRSHLTAPDIAYIDTLLRRAGVPALKSFLDARAEQAVRLLAKQVNGLLAQKTKLAVVWVVPEFNLEDWADPISNAPHLVGRGNKRWRDLDAQAGRALRDRDVVLAEKLAKEMTDLDGGTNAVPLRILAECCRSSGDLQGTRRYLEMCRDAEGWDPSYAYSPRVSCAIQNALREACSAPRNVIVDLPDIFGRYLDQALPNRRVFLDYCHLSAEGISVAMAAVASEVLAILAGKVVAPENLRGRSASPSPKIEGKAAFLAAVHNAHFYQSDEVVHYWCARAVQFWPECAQIMTRYIDFQTRRVPVMACRSALELFALDEMGTLEYLLRGRRQRLDLVLGDAIIEAVNKVGMDIGTEMTELRVKEHSIRGGPKELTDFYYNSAVLRPSERAWTSRSFPRNRGSRALYTSASWEASKFIFFAEKGRPLGIKLTYRVPTLSMSDGSIEIGVNGHRVVQASVGRTWQTLAMSILSDYTVDGVNEIVITWPNGEDDSEDALSRTADAIVAGRVPPFHRVFGEIHSLLVSDAAGSAKEYSGAHTVDSDNEVVSGGQ